MKTFTIALVAMLVTSVAGANPARVQAGSVIYVEAKPGLATAIITALQKKKTPVVVTTAEDRADYVLRVVTAAEKEGTAERVTKVLVFGGFAGSGKSRDTAVTLVDRDGTIVFSYQTNKVKIQSASEGIAKHLGEHIAGKR